MTSSPKARVFWPILISLLIADSMTKALAEVYLTPAHLPHDVVGSVVRLTLTYNRGAAMSLSLGPYSRIGFSVVALLALLVLGRLYAATAPGDRARAAALALLIGGTSGNLLNRLTSPHGVVDFIDVGVPVWRFWTFNLADAGITIGAALLLGVLWREKVEQERAESP